MAAKEMNPLEAVRKEMRMKAILPHPQLWWCCNINC